VIKESTLLRSVFYYTSNNRVNLVNLINKIIKGGENKTIDYRTNQLFLDSKRIK